MIINSKEIIDKTCNHLIDMGNVYAALVQHACSIAVLNPPNPPGPGTLFLPYFA